MMFEKKNVFTVYCNEDPNGYMHCVRLHFD